MHEMTISEGVKVIVPTMYENLYSVVGQTINYPDDTLVEIQNGPFVKRADGTFGPFRMPLQRLREEAWMRMAFPHDAETRVQ